MSSDFYLNPFDDLNLIDEVGNRYQIKESILTPGDVAAFEGPEWPRAARAGVHVAAYLGHAWGLMQTQDVVMWTNSGWQIRTLQINSSQGAFGFTGGNRLNDSQSQRLRISLDRITCQRLI